MSMLEAGDLQCLKAIALMGGCRGPVWISSQSFGDSLSMSPQTASRRLKALEAMAMRKPIVTTGVGCGGIDLVHGESALFADAPEAALSRFDSRLPHAPLLHRMGDRVVDRSLRRRLQQLRFSMLHAGAATAPEG